MTEPESYQQAGQFHREGRLDEAIAAYQRVIDLDGRFHPAWYSQGCALDAKGNHAAAMTCFRRAVSLAPEHRESHHNLGRTLFALGLTDEALDSFRVAIELGAGFLPRTAIAVAIPGSPRSDHQAVLDARRDWARTHLPAPGPKRRFTASSAAGRRLRVGYLSSFFAHPKWMKPVWGLVNHHDRERFEVHLFSDAPEARCQAGYRKQPGDRFHDISELSNQAAARRIEECGLDLLIDLNGYSRVDRLAVVALKPAPIVAGWFNFYATSGMACYDYLVGDDEVVRPEDEPFYLERILRVPGSYLTFEVSHPTPDVAEPPERSGGNLTFGCLASCYKITHPVVDAWARILARAPGTRLFLKNAALGCPENCLFLKERFARRGVDPDRLTLEGPAGHFDFLTAYRQVDVALDTFPYNGGTTTMEALWQGVPVLAFRGDRWAARQSASILRAAGLAEYVADTAEEYVERAVALAGDPHTLSRLTGMRRGMRSHLTASLVCDVVSFARNMEGLYARMLSASASFDKR